MSASEKIAPGLIVNADDLAIHPSINAGIVSAYGSGILSSATMLLTTPYLDETVKEIALPRILPIGIHLSLTLGKTAAGQHEVPDLANECADFIWSARQLLRHPLTGEKGRRLLLQIRREFEAQLALACDLGLRPTHVDSHQHVHMHPAIFSLVAELLPRYGIRRLRYSREVFTFSGVAELLKQGKVANVFKVALLRWLSRRVEPKLATTDDFFGVLLSGAVSKKAVMATVLGLNDRRSLEICIHPGFPVSKLEAAYSLGYVNRFISSPARQIEHDILIDSEIHELVCRRNLVLRSFDGREKPI